MSTKGDFITALQGGLAQKDPSARAGDVNVSFATFEEYTGGGMVVRYGNSFATVPQLTSVTSCTQGDRVLVLRQGAGLFVVIGKLA